jgi:MoxR-like ATPase
LALVAGYAGIGKSSLVEELQKALILPCGAFIGVPERPPYFRYPAYQTTAQK